MYERHGHSYKKLYSIWKRMQQRCLNSNVNNYHNYGGRGITVCMEWREFVPFMNWAYENGYDPNLSLDRIDNNWHYCPENCRWIVPSAQHRNTRRNIKLEAFGEVKLQKDWIDDPRCKTSATTFKSRVKAGWDIEEALTTPSKKTGKGACL